MGSGFDDLIIDEKVKFSNPGHLCDL